MLARAACLALMALAVSGCAHNSTPNAAYDPFEDTNRKVFGFNQRLDEYVLAPTARVYSKLTPRFVRTGVDNFFNNALYPNVILNGFLQGKPGQGMQDTGRFLVNSTIGILGLFDPATSMGLEAHNEDFGQTLAVWGVNSGPYLELPGLGPHNTRHAIDIPVQSATNVLYYAAESNVAAPLMILYYVNKRALLEKAATIRERAALDPYLFTRSAYIQYREQLIYDGSPPREDLYDDDLFDELDAED